MRQRILEQAAAEKELGWAVEDAAPTQMEGTWEDKHWERKGGVDQRISFLLNKGRILRDLVIHPVALELVGHVLGDNFLLSSFDANLAKKGGALGHLHRDAWWCPMPYGDGGPYVKAGDRTQKTTDDGAPKDVNIPPAACNMIWMLTDFTEENGGTRLVPGSHLLPNNPGRSIPHKGADHRCDG